MGCSTFLALIAWILTDLVIEILIAFGAPILQVFGVLYVVSPLACLRVLSADRLSGHPSGLRNPLGLCACISSAFLSRLASIRGGHEGGLHRCGERLPRLGPVGLSV